jgi:hypothetical protein
MSPCVGRLAGLRRTQLKAGSIRALSQCNQDAVAGRFAPRWFYLADIAHVHCKTEP